MQQDDKTKLKKLAGKLGGVTTKYRNKLNEALDAIEDRDRKILSLNKQINHNCFRIAELNKEIEGFPAAKQNAVKEMVDLNNQIHSSTVHGLNKKINELKQDRQRYAELSQRTIFKILIERTSIRWSNFKWLWKWKLKALKRKIF